MRTGTSTNNVVQSRAVEPWKGCEGPPSPTKVSGGEKKEKWLRVNLPIQERVRAEACGNIELVFYDLLDQLHTGHDAPAVEEALEAEHWTHAAFHHPVILFDNIVQVGESADLDGIIAFPF